MQANRDDLAALVQIQQIDMDIAKIERKLHELPQRKAILDARTKRREIEEKKSQLDELQASADQKLTKLGDEDSQLAEKQRVKQAEIDAARGGYRDIEARTKELNGFAKRRATLEDEINAATDELSRIEGLQAQVAKMLSDLDAKEKEATDSFVEEGGKLRKESGRRQAERDQLAATVEPELMKLYEKTASRCGGVALGYLKGTSCGVCRATIDHGRLIDMKASGNLAVCPNCGRLLIVVNQQN